MTGPLLLSPHQITLFMATPDPKIFENLANFYLGRQYDLGAGEPLEQLQLYDSKDLCTHALCVGMTGSGKTGLCLSLLEEAALDGIPAICVDPKGDLGNLLLTFPDFRPEDFRPYLDAGEAARRGISLDEMAESTAKTWKEGLASWGQDADRVRRLRDSVDVAIYTPGSNIGLPLTVLRSFDAPPPETLNDLEAIGERVTGSVSGLLTLMGLDADPMTSPEHILLSSILSHQWREGKQVKLADLIRLVQSPPIKQVGVLDVETFMPAGDRSKLAMRINGLLASPAFASWLQGEALSIEKLLHTEDNRPRLSILSIAHLDDNERMFFVTILLNELVAWMRRQSGTSSLRAMFYMDEVAGYFPPVGKPPSKPPMMTLLKQARAFGLGVTLATQNPVDLDYKGLSNIGTWFLGRLQTERDKARVLAGLEGAAASSGQRFDRAAMEQTLAALGNRVFLMNNVHDREPVTFQTRWAMSFLAGPLAGPQISELMKDRKLGEEKKRQERSEPVEKDARHIERPIIPIGIDELFLHSPSQPKAGSRLLYRAAMLGRGSIHFIRATASLDQWQKVDRILRCENGVPTDLWQSSDPLPDDADLTGRPHPDFEFTDLPDGLRGKGAYRSYRAEFKDYLYREHRMKLFKCSEFTGYAPGGADQQTATRHFQQLLREKRDVEIEKLRTKYESRVESVRKKIRTAEDRVDREASQYDQAKWSSVVNVGSSILGAFLGGRRSSVSTAARGVGRANQQRDDVRRAQDRLEELHEDIQKLEHEVEDEIESLKDDLQIENCPLEVTEQAPRKSDLKTEDIAVLWLPWEVDRDGIATPMY